MDSEKVVGSGIVAAFCGLAEALGVSAFALGAGVVVIFALAGGCIYLIFREDGKDDPKKLYIPEKITDKWILA